MADMVQFQATGRRKSAIARVILRPGSGQRKINGKAYGDYFGTPTRELLANRPLVAAEMADQYDVLVNAHGGGVNSQSGAVALGVARALLEINPELRAKLRAAGLLTRDSRMKERKKYGQKGARKRFQFSKR
ncbi:MAG TPA: 30S ribosomal protein S9 [Terriglobales bacterium]|jgi:small subunit ribosomal protein S9|nr:30S ribosomal protein S9 [Terriglobales bacterium]